MTIALALSAVVLLATACGTEEAWEPRQLCSYEMSGGTTCHGTWLTECWKSPPTSDVAEVSDDHLAKVWTGLSDCASHGQICIECPTAPGEVFLAMCADPGTDPCSPTVP